MKVLLVFLSSFLVLATSKILEFCSDQKCKLKDNCRCSTSPNPFFQTDTLPPQLVAITISELIDSSNYETYWKPLFFDRKNPNGSPIRVTFFVSHKNTDYTLVQDLYLRGHEIGVYSITNNQNKSYWVTASQQDLEEEFGGQKTIISTFANIPDDDITGVRTPLLQLNGDLSVKAYQSSGFTYDSSWPTKQYILPYTLDFASTQNCLKVPQCPEDSANFWIAPIITLEDTYSKECDSLESCIAIDDSFLISDFFYAQLSLIPLESKAPLILRLDSQWFQTLKSSYNGFSTMLDNLIDDGFFLVTVQDVLQWVQNPVSLENYKVPDHSSRRAECLNISCSLRNTANQLKNMKSCVPCPDKYPWKGNPLGKT